MDVVVRSEARADPAPCAEAAPEKEARGDEGAAEPAALPREEAVLAAAVPQGFEDAGVAAIIYTDIDRDGALGGLNIDATVTLADQISIPVIASGGLSSIDDLRKLIAANCSGIEGAISGRALYDGRLDPKEALNLLRGAA